MGQQRLVCNPSERAQKGSRRSYETKGDFSSPLIASHQFDANSKPPIVPTDTQEARRDCSDCSVRMAVSNKDAAKRPVDGLLIGPEKCQPELLRCLAFSKPLLFDL